jgi:hypothetical protein
MMGDPFGYMEIKKSLLIIEQNGGTSWKWNQTDTYQYHQGDFRLIRYAAHFGKICAYWQDEDFNLLTGKIVVKKEFENCEKETPEIYKKENEILHKKGIRLTLENRNDQNIIIVTPKYKHQIYMAVNRNGQQE